MSFPLLNLPPELLLKTASHLPHKDLSRLLRANRLCNTLLTPLLYSLPIRDDGGHLPVIFWATLHGHTSLVAAILDRGGPSTSNKNQYAHPDPGGRHPAHQSAARRRPCQNLLQWAVCCRRLETVELLLRRGASANARPHAGCPAPWGTALHYAVEPTVGPPSEEIVSVLVAHGADCRACDGEGDTALQAHLMSARPSDSIVRWMLDGGVDVNAVGSNGLTPLWTAVSGPSRYAEAVVGLLVERGADTGARLFGESLMHRVVLKLGRDGMHRCWLAALRFFLQRAQDVGVRDSCKQTLLHYAVAKIRVHSYAAVKLLVERGVDHRPKDIFGRTALDLALRAGADERVVCLLRGLDDPVQAVGLGMLSLQIGGSDPSS